MSECSQLLCNRYKRRWENKDAVFEVFRAYAKKTKTSLLHDFFIKSTWVALG